MLKLYNMLYLCTDMILLIFVKKKKKLIREEYGHLVLIRTIFLIGLSYVSYQKTLLLKLKMRMMHILYGNNR